MRTAFDSRLAWSGVAEDGLELHFVPGDHLQMMLELGISGLAPALKDCLDRQAQVHEKANQR